MQRKQVAGRLAARPQEVPELIGDPVPEECLVELTRCAPFERRHEAETRSWLAKLVVVAGLVATAVAGIVSLAVRSVTPILAVWGVAGQIIASIAAHYFPRGAST